jgi:hypothetical protein
MACAPTVLKLDKGYTEINVKGVWRDDGFGIFSMYKSDWAEIGGFNIRKYTTKWGGEDWHILDR